MHGIIPGTNHLSYTLQDNSRKKAFSEYTIRDYAPDEDPDNPEIGLSTGKIYAVCHQQ